MKEMKRIFTKSEINKKTIHNLRLKCSDTAIGEVRIGPNDEREHWKEALAHPNKRIFQWHQTGNPVLK